jgi:glycosyltransferase involved in cell wall biosynthesis
MVSRLTPLKRADLLVRALATADGAGIRAVIAGDGEERERLKALIATHDLGDRVTLVGSVDQTQLLHYLAHCRAVCFPPLQEDYGFVTIEAFSAQKAVVTCTDSGGPAELVRDGVEGFVAAPTPEALARSLRTLAEDPALAEEMGGRAAQRAAGINWPDTVRALTGV